MTEITPERIQEFVIAGHGNLDKVKAMLAETPELLGLAHQWRPGDTETALQGAAHVGNRAIAEYLLSLGAPLEITTAAMLGQLDRVREMLASDPKLAHYKGAHGIPLLPHAAFAGSAELMQLLADHGASEGASMALGFAASRGHLEVVKWLLHNTQPDLNWQNFQGKTALELATEAGHTAVADLIKQG